MLKVELVVKRFEELSVEELYDILKLRVEVFIVEQQCIYQEIDEKDKKSYHVFYRENGKIQAYLRVIDKGVSFDEVSIGRVISVKRRCGLASKLLAEGIKVAKEKMKETSIRIEAQTYARKLYEKQGFIQVSEEFLEDGIPHIEMLLR